MTVDSSALIAVVMQETRHDVLLTKLAAAEGIGFGTPTLVETGLVQRGGLVQATGTGLRQVQDTIV